MGTILKTEVIPPLKKILKLKLISIRPSISTELLAVIASLYFTMTSNYLFFKALLSDRDWSRPESWQFAIAMIVAVASLHTFILLLVLNRWTAKPLLSVLFVVTAAATFYMNRFTVFFDTDMIRNILQTDVKEAKELFSIEMLLYILMMAGVPIFALTRIKLKQRTLRRSAFVRVSMLIVSVVLMVGSIMMVFQDFSSLMRNHKEVRFLITPAGYLTSFIRVMATSARERNLPKIKISEDAKLGAGWEQRTKPTLFVMVVGETARAANWGLNGYARQTTPELAALDVMNFSDVTSCGTNTEVSVPCMFSTYGRRNYDEAAIRNHESLLHIIDHAGIKTIWRDNQGGCKGVCDGLEQQRLDNSKNADFCDGERCLDEILLDGMDVDIKKDKNKNLFVVLHQLGSHGPAYYRRYPPEMRKFIPTCDSSKLGKCSTEEVVNTYDNTVLYTDHFLAKTIEFLKKQGDYNTAMLYVSDHGESLGEKGIFLHGLPYSIAPKEQTQVPLVMWMSDGFFSSFDIDKTCLSQLTSKPVSHDNLFHTLLGLLQIDSKFYEQELDITLQCRKNAER